MIAADELLIDYSFCLDGSNFQTLKPETLKPETLKPKTLEPETLKPETLKPETMQSALSLELEVDKWLHLSSYKLVDHQDYQHAHQHHDWQWELGETVAIATLESLWQPMDNHAEDKEREYLPIGWDDLQWRNCPFAADALHHVLGYAPGCLVGFRRFKVRT